MKRFLLGLGLILGPMAAIAAVEYPSSSGPVGAYMMMWWTGSAAVQASAANPLPTADANGAAFQGVSVITPGTPITAARSVGFVLTTGCTETFTLADASTIALALTSSTSLQTLPLAVTNVAANGCIGTFWNLK
jgi:hypothetical protein